MIKQKNWTAIISVVLAIGWAILSFASYTDVSHGISSEDAAEGFGTLLAMGVILPYLIVSSIGVILHSIGGFVNKNGLFLAGLILECVSIVLMPFWGFGYIVVIIFGFIGYAKMRRTNS